MTYLLKLFGWKLNIEAIKNTQKSIIIAAPHTSNWDFIVGICAALASGIKFHFIIKKEWNKPIIGYLLLKLGAIFIDRSKPTGLTQQLVEKYRTMSEGHLIFTPEGTRSRVEKWKSGFYIIAHESRLPISVGYINYKEKSIGIDHTFYPTGNIEDDCNKLRTFYQTISAKNPKNYNPNWKI
ncbi:acyltransferase [Candidatus Marinamargulisbacteria bacterium SCGC AG-343-K17]|nr:acyltransferase [Candidatus Marinamargulisbacteria bacterium SCGC AG-343-K17]